MDSSLLDKEVLCILDTRRIQRYIFRSNSFIDTVGGSDLIDHILYNAIKYALKNVDPPLNEDEYDISLDPDVERFPYFVSDKIKFQIINCAAGNSMCIVRTGALCRQIIRKVSRYYIDHGYSLNLATAVTEKTDNLGNDSFNLYKNLNQIKSSAEISNPLGPLPIVMRELHTGEPVVAFDEKSGDYISRSSLIKRKVAMERPKITNPEDIITATASDGVRYRALIHSDGNNLGITMGKILQNTSDYEYGIRVRRLISRNIESNFTRILDSTMRELKDSFLERGGRESDFEYVFQIIHQAGDDLNCICRPDFAFKFISVFYKYLKGALLWDAPDLKIPFYVCTGVAIVPERCPFHVAFNFAEECCSSAKTEAKKAENLRDGFAGNWIDFQVYNKVINRDLDIMREGAYTTQDGINLLLRPYCLDEAVEDQAFSYYRFIDKINSYKALKLKPEDAKIFRLSYGGGKKFFDAWVSRKAHMGIDFSTHLGAPLYTKGDSRKSTWYDVAEVSDFFDVTEKGRPI